MNLIILHGKSSELCLERISDYHQIHSASWRNTTVLEVWVLTHRLYTEVSINIYTSVYSHWSNTILWVRHKGHVLTWHVPFPSLSSAEPDSDRSAGHHQGASGRPASRHRVPDPWHDHAVHLQGQLPRPRCDSCQHGPGQLRRSQVVQRCGPSG